MTYVGKILVIVIMAFSLIFLGISTVVFTTAKNWKTATEEQKKKVGDLTKKLGDAQAGVQAAQKDLEAAKVNFTALQAQLDNRIKLLEDENKRSQDLITTVSWPGGYLGDHGQDRAR